MKKVYIFMLVGILAIVMVIVSLMNFDPKVETWSSFIGGAAIAILIIKSPAIITYFKNRKQKNAK